jgi:hypothetical protein
MRKRAKPPANSGDTDDDVMGEEPTDDFDDDSSGPQLGGPRGPRGGTGSVSSGRSSGVYEGSGVNTMTNARMAASTPNSGSYNPSRRSFVSGPPITRGASARVSGPKPPNTDPPSLRKSVGPTDEQLRKRTEKYIWLKPEGRSTAEGVEYATAPKPVRRAMEKRWRDERLARVR